MLLSLSIKNYALIESLETDFSNQFSVITGETGAGKSILLGALGLVLGNRADLTSLKDKEQKCIIEATFSMANYHNIDSNITQYFSVSYCKMVCLSCKGMHHLEGLCKRWQAIFWVAFERQNKHPVLHRIPNEQSPLIYIKTK